MENVNFGSLVLESVLSDAAQQGRLIKLPDDTENALSWRDTGSKYWYPVTWGTRKSILSHFSTWRVFDRFSVLVPASVIDADAEPSTVAVELLFLTDDGSALWCLAAPAESELSFLKKSGFVKTRLFASRDSVALSARGPTFNLDEVEQLVWKTVIEMRISLASPPLT